MLDGGASLHSPSERRCPPPAPPSSTSACVAPPNAVRGVCVCNAVGVHAVRRAAALHHPVRASTPPARARPSTSIGRHDEPAVLVSAAAVSCRGGPSAVPVRHRAHRAGTPHPPLIRTLTLGFQFPATQSVAAPQAARGWAHPPCRPCKIQSCFCLGSAFEQPAFQIRTQPWPMNGVHTFSTRVKACETDGGYPRGVWTVVMGVHSPCTHRTRL